MFASINGTRRTGRLLVPVTLVLCTRIIGGLFLYYWLGLDNSGLYWMKATWGEGQNDILRLSVGQNNRWLYLFLGWDSAWYASITAKGYAFSNQSYAFFPGLPLMSWLVDSGLKNPLLSTVLSSAFLGTAWVPIFQLFVEEYLSESNSLDITLLYAFLPVVYVFSTVAYSEGLFLFSSLGAWYFYRKRRTLFAIILASIASISRPTGILIFVPFLMGLLKARRCHRRIARNDLACFLAPFSSFFLWLFYCRTVSGDWMAPFDRTGWNDSYSLFIVLKSILENGVEECTLGFLTVAEGLLGLYNGVCIALLIIPFFLLRGLYRIDRDLAVYSAAYLAGILFFGNWNSSPRFVSCLFPVWMTIIGRPTKKKLSKVLTLVISASFYLIALFLWSSFLNGVFLS